MAVVVQCFHCNAILELDDGFRGGVCRCSSCGELLQVPASSEQTAGPRAARPAHPGQVAAGRSAHSAIAPQATGRSATADDGGSSSGLRRVQKTQPLARESKSPHQNHAPTAAQIAGARSNRREWTLWTLLLLLIALCVGAAVAYSKFHG